MAKKSVDLSRSRYLHARSKDKESVSLEWMLLVLPGVIDVKKKLSTKGMGKNNNIYLHTVKAKLKQY